MSIFLTYQEEFLKEKKGYWTAKEICQQPRIWREAAAQVEAQRTEIDSWLQPILALQNLRIILTGAGTSAYVGEAIVPSLIQSTGRIFKALSTTDIVGNAPQYLLKNIPTLLVSYGRSGNSPESVAAVKLADQIVDDCYHLVITCNPEGELVLNSKGNVNAFSLLMPEGTLDQSFAMTSSFSTMLLTALALLDAPSDVPARFVALADQLEALLPQFGSPKPDRAVYVGSGPLTFAAREAALKVMELSAGQIPALWDSALGFRHGPKSFVIGTTNITVFTSPDTPTTHYEADLVAELKAQFPDARVTTMGAQGDINIAMPFGPAWAAPLCIAASQIDGVRWAAELGLNVDNPFDGQGTLSRVVSGVKLYPVAS